jgi:hypothetical protein
MRSASGGEHLDRRNLNEDEAAWKGVALEMVMAP